MANSPIIYKGSNAKMINSGALEFKDGTLIQVNDGDPNGVVTSVKGSLLLDKTNAIIYKNTDGTNTGWSQVGSEASTQFTFLTDADFTTNEYTLTDAQLAGGFSTLIVVDLTATTQHYINLPAGSATLDGLGVAVFYRTGTAILEVRDAVAANVQTFNHSNDTITVIWDNTSSDWLIRQSTIATTSSVDVDKGSQDATEIDTLEDLINFQWSAGLIGTAPTVTDNTDNTCEVGTFEVILRSSNTIGDPLRIYKLAALTAQSVPAESLYYLSADYNAGSPIAKVTTPAAAGINNDSVILIGFLFNTGGVIHFMDVGETGVDVAQKYHSVEEFRFGYAAKILGGSITTSGTRYIQATAGYYRKGASFTNTAALDTTGAGTFISAYGDSTAGFTRTTAQTQLNNTHYWNSSTNTLTALSAGRYTVRWIYQVLSSTNYFVEFYHNAQYTNLALARAATVPSDRPVELSTPIGPAVLLARIIVEEGNADIVEIENYEPSSTIPTTPTTSHNELDERDVAGNHAKIIPVADSTTAFQVTKADGTTVVVCFDTTNKRLGIGGTPTTAMDIFCGTENARVFGTGTATQGLLHLRSVNGQKTYFSFTEDSVGDRGGIGFDAGSSTMSFIVNGTLASGTKALNILANGNVGINKADADEILEIDGRLHISEETSPSAPSAGDGGIFYVKNDGKPYYISATTPEVDLSASSTPNHNDTTNIQGGTTSEYYHLTSAQHTIATQAASATVAGYVITTAQTFNGTKSFKSVDGHLIQCRTTSSGVAGYGYLSFYEGDTSTRLAYIGNGTTSNNNLSLHTDVAAIELDSKTSIYFLTDSATRMEINSSGNLGLGVTPSASSIRCAVRGLGADASTYPIFLSNSAAATLFYVTDSGFTWCLGDMSCANLIDRTPYPSDLQTAIDAVNSMERLPDGEYDHENKEHQLDHSKLHPYLQGTGEEANRCLSSSVSCLNEVVKHLLQKNQELEARIEALEAK